MSGTVDRGQLNLGVEIDPVGGAHGSLGGRVVLGAGLENERGVWWGS